MIDANHRKDQVISFIKDCILSIKRNDAILVNEENYIDIEDFIPHIKDFCSTFMYGNTKELYCERINDTNNIVIYKDDGDQLGHVYSVFCSDIMAFSGTIGVHQVEEDSGISSHIKYMGLFVDSKKLNSMASKIDTDKPIKEIYLEFYKKLKEYFETDPMSLYNLMTGIKSAYSLGSKGLIVTPEEYKVVTFDKFKSINLVNLHSKSFSFELSSDTPNLKIYYEGCKLLHIRTKIEDKNNKKRLRVMIETGKRFFENFKKISGI